MIQQYFWNLIPRIESKFKDLFVITDEIGREILTDLGQTLSYPVSQNLFTLKRKYSSKTEFSDELAELQQSDAMKRFPCIYINSDLVKVTYDNLNEIATFGEIDIINLSDPIWKTEDRDSQSFEPILNNLYDLFIQGCNLSKDFSLVSKGTRHDCYFWGVAGQNGGIKAQLTDHVDVINITNLQVRIYKHCEQ